jgi:lysophospholipase L1-like esterase
MADPRATAISITSPSPASGVVGVQSGVWTVQVNGQLDADLTVTPSAGAGGGTFAPSSMLIAASATPAAASFRYTPASTGAKLITLANDRGLSNPAPAAYTSLAVQPSARVALMGDSLTDRREIAPTRNWSPFFWSNGLGTNGGQQLVQNCGVNGDTVGQMLARVNNSFADSSPGLAGIAPLGHVYIRAGTNDARALTPIGTLAADLTSLLQACKSYCTKVIILAVPPMGPSESNFAAKNAVVITYNAWLAQYAADNAADFLFVDDCVNLRDGAGAQLAGYFNVDGVHNEGRATWRQGVDGAAAMASYFATFAPYPSPLVLTAADVHPTTAQYVPNVLMAGSGGTAGAGVTGQVADSWTIAQTASGNEATVSKVAADVGDANQTPWQRITPTLITNGGGFRMSIPFGISNLTAVQTALEMVMEVRLVNWNAANFSALRAYVNTSIGKVTWNLDLKMSGPETLNHTLVLRHAQPRNTATTPSSPALFIDLLAVVAASGAMGSIDVRNASVRQL